MSSIKLSLCLYIKRINISSLEITLHDVFIMKEKKKTEELFIITAAMVILTTSGIPWLIGYLFPISLFIVKQPFDCSLNKV